MKVSEAEAVMTDETWLAATLVSGVFHYLTVSCCQAISLEKIFLDESWILNCASRTALMSHIAGTAKCFKKPSMHILSNTKTLHYILVPLVGQNSDWLLNVTDHQKNQGVIQGEVIHYCN